VDLRRAGGEHRSADAEWVSLDPATQDRWLDLATEALDFVGLSR
jgi:hypothetical protein